jgi:monoamine oxidase
VWREALAWVERLPDEDVSFDDALARPAVRRGLRPEVRDMLRAFVEGFNAADARRVSCSSLRRQAEASEEEHGERASRVRDGYDVLPERLARPLAARGRLRLGLAVTSVRLRQEGVEVTTRGTFGGRGEALRARAALVTLPLGVLQAPRGARGAVEFVPPLPRAKREAIARLAMGRVVKVVVRFRGPLGTGPLAPIGSGTAFLHAPRAPVPTWWVPVPAPPSCLVGWVAGPPAERFVARAVDASARVETALRGLARRVRIDPAALVRFVEDARVFDWGEDPWARGAYSWVPVGALDAPSALAAPVGGRLFFAGEATDAHGDTGTVHAALASGARAADEIRKRFSGLA